MVVKSMPKMTSKFLDFAEWSAITKALPSGCTFQKLYTGSEHDFSASKFHEFCDEKGPTLTVCKSEFEFIFGFFTHVPWRSVEEWVKDEKGAFVFRLENPKKLFKLNLSKT